MGKEIGIRIRQIRRLHGYSQEYMSEKMGICKKKLFRIENGASTIDPDLLKDVAYFLDVDVACLHEFDSTEFLRVFSKLNHLKRYFDEASIPDLVDKIDLNSFKKDI